MYRWVSEVSKRVRDEINPNGGLGPDPSRNRVLRAVRHAAVAPRVGWAGGG